MDAVVDDLRHQAIFTPLWATIDEEPAATTTGGYSRVAVRNSRDVFYAKRLMVRCCTLGSGVSKYNLLVSDAPSLTLFQIEGISLNRRGTLLAVYGMSTVQLFHLPESLPLVVPDADGKAAAEIPVLVFETKLESPLVKFIWHPLIAGDGVFVTLTEDQKVSVFDLRVLSKPVLQVDLKQEPRLESHRAVLIGFGSKTNLTGALTLYILTELGSVFAIYPFLPPNTTIVTTAKALEQAYADAVDVVGDITEQFPTSTTDSYLKKSVIRQQAFFQQLLTDSQRPGVVSETLYPGSPPQVRLQSPIDPASKPIIQGPIAHIEGENFYDIEAIYDNSEYAFLAALSQKQGKNHCTYLAQLAPLVCVWNEPNDNDDHLKVKRPSGPRPSLDANVPAYRRPRRGFGFVNSSAIVDQKLELFKQEISHWVDEYWQLSTVVSEPVAVSGDARIVTSPAIQGRIWFRRPNGVVEANIDDWMRKFTWQLASNEQVDVASYKSEYKVLDTTAGIDGLAVVSDTVMRTGLVVAVVHGNTGQLTIHEIVLEKPQKRLINDSLPNTKPQPKVASTPDTTITELIAGVKALENVPDIRRKIVGVDIHQHLIGNKPLEATSIALEAAVTATAKFNQVAIQLHHILTIEIDKLHKQLATLNKISPSQDIGATKERVEAVCLRQEELLERYKQLKDRLFDNVRRATATQQLPLSQQEKQWFAEINKYTSEIGSDNSKLTALVELLSTEVRNVLDLLNNRSSDQLTTTYENAKHVKRLHLWLDEEGKSIDALRAQIEQLSVQI